MPRSLVGMAPSREMVSPRSSGEDGGVGGASARPASSTSARRGQDHFMPATIASLLCCAEAAELDVIPVSGIVEGANADATVRERPVLGGHPRHLHVIEENLDL